MSIFTKLGADIAAPTDAAGAPRKVVNGEFQTWMTEVERLIQIATGNGDLLLFNSKDDLDSSLNHPANTGALLIGESIADDGLYMKQGASGAGSWVKIGGVPGQGFVKATNTGTGTSTAIEASTPVAVNETQLILLPIAAENAGSPVTVSFNGGSPLTIKTVSGSDVAAGGLPASSVMIGTIQGSTFRLLSDQASVAIQAAAEAARDEAVAAASSVQSKLESKAYAEASYHPVLAPDFIETAGFATAGDGGGALYKKVGAEPSHAGKFFIILADGVTVVWYEYVTDGGIYNPKAFGMSSTANDNSERLEAIIECIRIQLPTTAQVASRPIIEFGGDRYTYERQVNLGVNLRRGLALRGGTHLCSTSTSWGATDVLFWCERILTYFLNMDIDPQRMAGAIALTARCRIEGCTITNFGWVGVWLPSSNYRGNSHIINSVIGKYDTTSPEYAAGVAWPEAPAILQENVDLEIVECQIRWSNPNILVKSGAGYLNIHGGHVYCGRANHGVDSFNLIVEAGAYAVRLYGVYIDAGYCDIYNNATDFLACGFMVDNSVQPMEAFIRAYPQSNGQASSGLKISGARRLISSRPYIVYKDISGGDAWDAGIKAIGTFMAGGGSGLSYESEWDIVRWATGTNAVGEHVFGSQGNGCRVKLLDAQNMANHSNAPTLRSEGSDLYISAAASDILKILSSGSEIRSERPFALATYTLASVPAASGFRTGTIAMITNSGSGGGAQVCYSDGTNWRRISDGAVAGTS